MNQILATNNSQNNNDYRKIDTKKIIVFFCVVLIIFGLAIIGVKLYNKIEDNKKNRQTAIKPEISIEQQGEHIKIAITCEDGINSVKYTWNNTDTTEIPLSGTKMYEKMLDIPEGNSNSLEVYTTTTKNVTGREYKVFAKDVDNEKPVIDSFAIEGSNLTITVKDNEAISNVIYTWEGKDAVTVKAKENEKTEMKVTLEAERGAHKLTFKVVDQAGNKEETTKIIKGVKQPEITAIRYDGKVNIKVTHDMGFKQIKFTINNKLYVYDEEYSGYSKDKTEIEYNFPIKEGDNIILVEAYSLEQYEETKGDVLDNYAKKVFKGKCDYTE